MTKIKTIEHREFQITIYAAAPSRCGQTYFAKDNYGEPVASQLYFSTIGEAVADGKTNLDACLDQ